MGLDADDAIGWIGLEGDIDELGRIVVPEREDRDQHRRVESDGRNRLQDLEQEGEPPRSGPKRIAGKSTCGRETTRPPKRYQNHPWPAGHSFSAALESTGSWECRTLDAWVGPDSNSTRSRDPSSSGREVGVKLV